LAKVGGPVDGIALDIRAEGRSLGDRDVGEIYVQGDSVTPGYLGEPDQIEGRWLPTGDLGYLVEGELVVCGHSKDAVIIAGKNLYPEDIERVTGAIEGIWRGNVAVFGVGVGGHERLVVVAESEASDRRTLARIISSTVFDWAEVSVGDVRIVEPRSIPKTASGKRSRSGCRDLYMSGQI
jgi:fatty-acyl-CoA synthase